MSHNDLDFIESDETKGKLIVRQYTKGFMGLDTSEDIELTSLEDMEYLRDQLNKFISKWKVKYAGYEKRNS